MDIVVLPSSEVILKFGKLFLEARIRDEVRDDGFDNDRVAELKELLETHFSSGDFTFEMLEDVLADDYTADLKLGKLFERVKNTLQSLKVVEYLGPHLGQMIYSSMNTRIEVHVYEIFDNPRSLEENEELPQAEITTMPHISFDGVWDELVFEEDIKGDLIWMMTNIIRRSLRSQGNTRRKLNPLILLYGPPGTGKTSLCQGLAQKIAIRQRSKYDNTTLIQINTATLLSKYYSESAKQVDAIFTKIARMCQEDPRTFICVLIDEVESIASSREFSTIGGESHDSLRATNALLTGLDKTKNYPNLTFLCTSNMLDALDSAFLDRCRLKREVVLPSLVSKYEILRKSLQELVKTDVIQTDEEVPPYDDVKLCAFQGPTGVGSRLLAIAELVNESPGISGRSLTQLPEQAIDQFLREDECDIDMALSFIERLVKLIQSQQEKEDRKNGAKVVQREPVETHNLEGIEIRGKKRTLKIWFEEDFDLEILEKSIEAQKQTSQASGCFTISPA